MKYILTILGLLSVCYLSAQVQTEIEGGIKIGNTSLLEDGIIRFTGSDFEGRSNGIWKSFTNGTGNGFWALNANGDLFNTTNGKIGIGLNDPMSPLHIKGNSNILSLESNTHAYIQFYPDTYAGGRKAWIGFGSGITDDFSITNHESNGSIKLRTDSKDVLTIKSNGFVGIGNNNPTTHFDVSLTDGNVGFYENIGNPHFAGIQVNTPAITGARGHLRFLSGGSLQSQIYTVYNEDINTSGLYLRTFSPDSKIIFQPNSQAKVTINGSNGYMGLATTEPLQMLHLDNGGNILLQSDETKTVFDSYRSGDAGGVILQIDPKPENATATSVIRLFRSVNSTGNQGLQIFRGNGTTEWNHYLSSKNHTYFARLNGNVAIGNITPIQKLDVVGVVRANYNSAQDEFIEFGHGGANAYINNSGDGDLDFRHDGVTLLSLKDSGKVVIGTPPTPGNYKLYVDGGILAEEVKVALSNASDWADDAFDKSPTIEEVESSINENSHLKDMPSADFLVENGYSLKEMDANILQQVEWLWVHMIELKKENEILRTKISQFEKEKD